MASTYPRRHEGERGRIFEILSKFGDSNSTTNFVDGAKSHILTCLGALIEYKNTTDSWSCDDRLFLDCVSDICSSAIRLGFRNEEGKTAFISRDTPLADRNVCIALACHGLCYPLTQTAFPTAFLDDLAKAKNVWRPLHWAAITTKSTSTGVFVDVLRDQVYKMKPRKIDNVTVAHVASATKHTNIQILKKIRERCPDFALQRDVFGDTPAHYAAKYTESVDMLQFFIEADPTVLEMQGHDGNSPLHALVDRLDGDDLLLGLMECILSTQEGKNSLLIFNSQGNTPLSTACTKRNRRDVSGVISRLILANPDALKVSNLRGRLPIHELIENRAYPDEPMRHCLSTMVTFYEQFSRDGELNYFEPSSTLGRTLLHTVCDSPHGVRPEVIKQVLLAYPEAAAVSYDDIYPLDNILLKYQSFHAFEGEVTVDEVLFLILDAYPESAKVMRPSGWYPLHEAAHGCSLTAVQMVYEAYPEVIFSSVHRNGTPLHQASQNFNNGVVEFLLAKYPDAVRIPNESFGQLPLHFAIDQFRSLEAVRGLFDFYPVAVIIPYTNGPSVLHYLFQRAYEIQRLRNPTSLWGDIVRFALRHCPAAATSSDSYGRTVYHWAVINKDSTHPYFLRLLLRAAPELDPDELRRLNSEDRRGALYLLLLAIFPIGEGKTIWQRLKEHGDRQLFKEVILFL